LDKQRLEFWHSGWEQWRVPYSYEAAETNPKVPN
jgi:hypothetical protein